MIRISSLMFWFCLAIVTSLALYGTSNRVQDLGKRLRTLNARIEMEQTKIHVLKAEWVYLTNPARIEAAARKFLAMNPTSLSQVARLEDLQYLLPARSETAAGAAVKSAPLASVGSSLPAPAVASAAGARDKGKNSAAGEDLHINTHMLIRPAAKGTPQAGAGVSPTGNQILVAESEPPAFFRPSR